MADVEIDKRAQTNESAQSSYLWQVKEDLNKSADYPQARRQSLPGSQEVNSDILSKSVKSRRSRIDRSQSRSSRNDSNFGKKRERTGSVKSKSKGRHASQKSAVLEYENYQMKSRIEGDGSRSSLSNTLRLN